MKSNSIKAIAAVIFLSTTMCTRVADKNKREVQAKSESEEEVKQEHSFEGNFDWKENMTIAERKRDDSGLLLPLQSYEETILRGMSFLLEDHLKWFRGSADNLIDEKEIPKCPGSTIRTFSTTVRPFPIP